MQSMECQRGRHSLATEQQQHKKKQIGVCLGLLSAYTMGCVAYNQQKTLLTGLEAGTSKMRARAVLVSGEGTISSSAMAITSLCHHMWEGQRCSLGSLLEGH